MSTPSPPGPDRAVPCMEGLCNRSLVQLGLGDQAAQSYAGVIGTMIALCVEGIIVNCLGLYVLGLSFVMKEGGVWLAVVGACDLMQCVCILPFEIHSLLRFSTVDVAHGVCFLITVLDSWSTCLVVFSNVTAVLCVFVLQYFPRFVRLRKRYMSIVLGVNIITSMGIGFMTLLARPSGYLIFTPSRNPSRALKRTTCAFRDAMFMESFSVSARAFLGLRLVFLILLTMLMVASVVFSLFMQKRQNDVGVDVQQTAGVTGDRIDAVVPFIDVLRLMEAVDVVVDDIVKVKADTNLTSQVQDILAADMEVIQRVLDLYFSEDTLAFDPTTDPLPSAPSEVPSARDQPTSVPDPLTRESSAKTHTPFSPNPPPVYPPGYNRLSKRASSFLATRDFPAVSKMPVESLRSFSKTSSDIQAPGLGSRMSVTKRLTESTGESLETPNTSSAAVNPPAGVRPSLAGLTCPEHALARKASSEPNLFYDASLKGRPSLDVAVQSALAYLQAPETIQLNLRKEMVYQRVLSRLMRDGYCLKRAAPDGLYRRVSDTLLVTEIPGRNVYALRDRESVEYTESQMNSPGLKSQPVVDQSIVMMTCVSVLLMSVSLIPLSLVYLGHKKHVMVTTTAAGLRQYIWSEVYFLHSTLRPLFYFILVPKFRARFFFLFCRRYYDRRHAPK